VAAPFSFDHHDDSFHLHRLLQILPKQATLTGLEELFFCTGVKLIYDSTKDGNRTRFSELEEVEEEVFTTVQ
jgi:hypothetical protein